MKATAGKKIEADGGGLRYNVGKNRLELIPLEWEWALGDVLTRGAAKYAPRNWERGMTWSTMVGCARRHEKKFLAGERYDQETGCHHLAMAAWNLLALMSYDLRDVGENDMPDATTLDVLARVNRDGVKNDGPEEDAAVRGRELGRDGGAEADGVRRDRPPVERKAGRVGGRVHRR